MKAGAPFSDHWKVLEVCTALSSGTPPVVGGGVIGGGVIGGGTLGGGVIAPDEITRLDSGIIGLVAGNTVAGVGDGVALGSAKTVGSGVAVAPVSTETV